MEVTGILVHERRNPNSYKRPDPDGGMNVLVNLHPYLYLNYVGTCT